jgi:hypothetical protein
MARVPHNDLVVWLQVRPVPGHRGRRKQERKHAQERDRDEERPVHARKTRTGSGKLATDVQVRPLSSIENSRDTTPSVGRFLEAFVAFVLAVAIAAAAGASAGATTVVSGRVLLDPASPVCRAGGPCSRPLAGFKLVFSRRGAVKARARTDTNGRYETALAAGEYAVTAPGHKSTLGRGLAPRRIRIPAAGHVTRNFSYDAGIR